MTTVDPPGRALYQLDPADIGLLEALDRARSAQVDATVRQDIAEKAMHRSLVALERIRQRFLVGTLTVQDLDKAIAAVRPDKAPASERAA